MRSRDTAAEDDGCGTGRSAHARRRRRAGGFRATLEAVAARLVDGRLRATAPGLRRTIVLLAIAGLPALASTASAQSPSELPAGLGETVERHHGFPAVPADALAEVGVAEDVRAAGARLEGTVDGREVAVTAGSPFVRAAGEVAQLPNAPYLHDGRLWLPVRFLSAAGIAGGGATRAAGPSRRAAGRASGPSAEGSPASRAEERGPWRVVLDPGHGGRDPGAHGPRGTREKDVVLEIARRVRDRLERASDIEVSLTRDGDEFVPLEERSRIAMRREADLFVSIHANSARRSGVRGFETYFLGEARTEESRRVAMRENAAIQYQEDSEWSPEEQVEYILTSKDQQIHARESNYVAGFIQNRLRRRHPGADRGVKQAGFYVLMGSTPNMPSVLVETGFLSNPASERYLAGAQGQAEVARSLADAVEAYFEEWDRRRGLRTASR